MPTTGAHGFYDRRRPRCAAKLNKTIGAKVSGYIAELPVERKQQGTAGDLVAVSTP